MKFRTAPRRAVEIGSVHWAWKDGAPRQVRVIEAVPTRHFGCQVRWRYRVERLDGAPMRSVLCRAETLCESPEAAHKAPRR